MCTDECQPESRMSTTVVRQSPDISTTECQIVSRVPTAECQSLYFLLLSVRDQNV